MAIEDWKPTKDENPDFSCTCGSNEVLYKEIDEIHGDYKYMCQTCGNIWIVEGPDA